MTAIPASACVSITITCRGLQCTANLISRQNFTHFLLFVEVSKNNSQETLKKIKHVLNFNRIFVTKCKMANVCLDVSHRFSDDHRRADTHWTKKYATNPVAS